MSIAKTILCARELRPWLVALAVVTGLHGLTNRCLAQGGNNLLPDPISSRELAGYLDRLHLTDEQGLAIEPIHEQYLAAFRTLREGTIQKILDEYRVLSDGSSGYPPRELVERFQRNLDRALAKIKQADNRLFGEIQLVLSEAQWPALSRVKLARARKRWRSGVVQGDISLNRGEQVDLTELYDRLELTPQQRQISDPLIIAHERVLTRRLKDLRDAGNRLVLDLAIAFEEMGFSQGDMSDPETWRKTMLPFIPIRTELGKSLLEPASAISNLNRKTIHRLTEVLEQPKATELRRRYYRAAYRQAGYFRHSTQKRFAAALQRTDLTEQVRESITAAAQEHQRAGDRMTEEMIDHLDDVGGNFTTEEFDEEQWNALRRQMKAFEARWDQLDQAASESLDAVLGPQLVAMFGDRAGRSPQENSTNPQPAGVVVEGAKGGVAMRPTEGDLFPIDPLIPNPLGERQLERFAQRLALSNVEQAIAARLHENYVAQYHVYRTAQTKAARRAPVRHGDPSTDEARQVRLHQQRQALQEAQELDAMFFDDLALAFGEREALFNELQRLKLARRRSIFSRREAGFRFKISPVDTNEAWVDLSELVDELHLDATTIAKIDDIMRAYETVATPAFKARYEVAIAAQHSRLNAEANRARYRNESEDLAAASRREYRQAMLAALQATHETERTVIQLNRATLERILNTLDGPIGQALRTVYNRKAFPSIYNNPVSAERFLLAAAKLPDLSDSQRGSIQTISCEYQDVYDALGTQIVLLTEPSGSPILAYDDPATLRNYGRLRHELAVIEFDRNELDAKALRRLRTILTPEQQARINFPVQKIGAP